ncbi:hypothetical protein GCM10023152_08650 [Agromyces bauzanensis]|uniref:Uncharacterized protein n=1 Tax=Agromyces bauzanensis TaxID=1308924 RepID=A0A917PR25_9MICO|nr:hypothetical protein GCM10011372_27960 [Agromyces bauzanensis]
MRCAATAIHTAAPADGAPEFNASVIDTVIGSFAGTGKQFVLTSGAWIHGAGTDIRDDDAPDPPGSSPGGWRRRTACSHPSSSPPCWCRASSTGTAGA